MSATYYEGHAILQVTTGQCARCRACPVFSVLVEESSEDGEHYRTFYACERSLIPWHYSAHECQSGLDKNAAWRRWQSSSLLQWLRPGSAAIAGNETYAVSPMRRRDTASPHGVVTPGQH